jgi:hypothetical protein
MVWAFTLTTTNFITNSLIAIEKLPVFGVLSRSVRIVPHHFSGNSTPESQQLHPTLIGIAENQLSLSLISLSPLTTGHPRILPHSRVRPSTTF